MREAILLTISKIGIDRTELLIRQSLAYSEFKYRLLEEFEVIKAQANA